MDKEERLKELERMFQALLEHLDLEIDYVPDHFKVFDPKEYEEGDNDG